jgi:hypothetical protein
VRRAIALDPEFWIGYVTQGQALERMNRVEPAIESPVQAGRFSGQNSKTVSLRGALAEGLPYQTLISSLLHKYASGRLKEV